MPFKDLREFIARLEKEGEAVKIEQEVDWNLEAGAMLRRSAEEELPAPFFQKLKGYSSNYRAFGGAASKYSRIAISMDMKPDTHPRDLMDEFLRRKAKPIKPVLVKDGPCKENIDKGAKIDLFKFPLPIIHDGDGGRWLGSWHDVVGKDPDSDWVNWSMQRLQAHSKNTFGILADPYSHFGGMRVRAYEANNKVMEVAVFIGAEPVSTLCASNPVPHGISEGDVAGGLRGEPVPMVKCETVDLTVPATSEIVIEGEIRPGERKDEGPFGEWTGYMGSLVDPKPVIHVRCVTHRNNPIFTFSCPGVPVDDDLSWTFGKNCSILEALRKRGLPVTGVYLPPECASLLALVSVKTTYANIAEDIAHVVWGTGQGRNTPYLYVFDEDVDVFNTKQWLHALVSKCHPEDGIIKQKHATLSPLTPFLNRHDRLNRMGAKAYFDATWPLDWDPKDVPVRSSFADIYPPAVQKAALAKWKKAGYK